MIKENKKLIRRDISNSEINSIKKECSNFRRIVLEVSANMNKTVKTYSGDYGLLVGYLVGEDDYYYIIKTLNETGKENYKYWSAVMSLCFENELLNKKIKKEKKIIRQIEVWQVCNK